MMQKDQFLIMVVDDEPFILRSLSYVLQAAGYRVETASDGQEAWEKLNKGIHPDLIFLDIMMPRLNGFEFCQLIKSDPRFQEIYVIFLSARWQNVDKETAERVGGNEFISKPFSPKEIVRRVEQVLSQKVRSVS